MRTVFDIVLGILFTVAKACLHAFASTAGVLALGAIIVLAAGYAWRRGLVGFAGASRAVEEDEAVSIER
jgi:hypothetical protein